jgi:tripartite-type tricarboxylate transporter receptor subunit TctC
VPGYKAIVWDGISAPAKTPPDIVNKLNTEINAVLRDPAMQKKFADLGSEAMITSPAEFGKFTADEAAKWGKVIKTVGIKAQ